ncbi:MAG: hypothetical protein Q8L35_07915 [Actinomycetota bacterium]|nr:hypothetical protein [Actinomycetota bacterium]
MANDIHSDEETLSSVAGQVSAEVKSSVIEIYEDLIRTVWAKIVPTLGTVTVATIMQRAISRTAARHPVLNDLTVNDAGFVFTQIKAKLNSEDKDELKDSFKELVANVFDILAKLTGNILVQQLMKEVEGLELP